MKLVLAGLGVLLVVTRTPAEYRTVLVQAEQDQAGKVSGSNRPDEKKASPAHKASDMVLIANWLCGKDPDKAFARPFGDGKLLTEAKEPLLYTDIAEVKAPAGLKAVNYEFIQARMRHIKSGHRASPAVLIVRSSLDEPPESRLVGLKGEAGSRVYYVEVAIGNLAWHRLKVVLRDTGDRPSARILWHKQS
jgi:hypothetical protein